MGSIFHYFLYYGMEEVYANLVEVGPEYLDVKNKASIDKSSGVW